MQSGALCSAKQTATSSTCWISCDGFQSVLMMQPAPNRRRRDRDPTRRRCPSNRSITVPTVDRQYLGRRSGLMRHRAECPRASRAETLAHDRSREKAVLRSSCGNPHKPRVAPFHESCWGTEPLLAQSATPSQSAASHAGPPRTAIAARGSAVYSAACVVPWRALKVPR
jgi:hypothetical protein